MATNTDRIAKLEQDVKNLKESNRIAYEILGHLSEVAKGQVENYPQIMSLLEVASTHNDSVDQAPEETTEEEASE